MLKTEVGALLADGSSIITSNPSLDALLVIYFVDQVRILGGSLQVLSRWLFLGEMFGVVLFVLWFINSPRWSIAPADRLSRTIRVCARIAVVVFSAALVANILGYVNFGNLIGTAMLRGAYLATILYLLSGPRYNFARSSR